MMIELGKKAKDKVIGFEGVIIGRCQYLTGCDQYGLAPLAKDGETKRAEWFDEGRVEIIGDGVKINEVSVAKNGGPNRDAPI
jgi:hypothetical protein